MKLTPPPGPRRGYRRARTFRDQIAILRSEGYSCEQIRAALANAGVIVSRSTMQREVTRLSMQREVPTRQRSDTPPGPAASRPLPPIVPASSSAVPTHDARSGKDVAEAFFSNRITNPFFLNRSRP